MDNLREYFESKFSNSFHVSDVVKERLMVNWYSDLYAKIKWNNQLSEAIPILKGTRQGGLSSPVLFNMFYKSLIDKLNSSTDGIIIDKHIYNALCYADDVMLMSTTVTGLQSLINTAVKHITDRGLSFNSQKTECYINGKNPFMRMPEWFINDDKLIISESLNYLGTKLDSRKGLSHVESRISKANKAFYSLQGAGLYNNTVSPATAIHMYKTAVQSGLLYGCCAMEKTNLNMMERIQSKHVKTILGLGYKTHSTKLLEVLRIEKVSKLTQKAALDLLKLRLCGSSVAKQFYGYLLCNDKRYTCNTHIG